MFRSFCVTAPSSGIKTLLTILLGAGALPASVAAQNQIENSGFEEFEGPSLGNNLNNTSIGDWQTTGNSGTNVVRVDGPGEVPGQPGEFEYVRGPEFDATNPGAGIRQQYLDVIDGSDDFFQTFTAASCPIPGQVQRYRISGFFSSRADRAGNSLSGSGAIRIREGAGVTGDIVAGPDLSLTIQDRLNWTQVSGDYVLVPGETYSFVVSMDNNINFDDAFAGVIGACEFVEEADLQTLKTLASGNATPANGETVSFNITVTNNGALDATGVSLNDTIPAGLNPNANNGSVSGTGASTGGSYTAGTGLWDIGNLAVGDTATLSIEGVVGADVLGSTVIENVTTRAVGQQPDTSTIGDDLTESVTVAANPLLAITKVADDDEFVTVGQEVTYTYTARNTGNVIIRNVAIDDVHNGAGPAPTPVGETLTTDAGTTGDSTDATADDGIWSALAPGDVVTFTGTYIVQQADIDNLQ